MTHLRRLMGELDSHGIAYEYHPAAIVDGEEAFNQRISVPYPSGAVGPIYFVFDEEDNLLSPHE